MQSTKLEKVVSELQERYGNLIVNARKRSINLYNDTTFIKLYISKDAQTRFNNEVAFFNKYQSSYIPKIVTSFKLEGYPVLVQENLSKLKGQFLSDDNIMSLSVEEMLQIIDVLTSIQSQESEGIVVHADLVPHNIYHTIFTTHPTASIFMTGMNFM